MRHATLLLSSLFASASIAQDYLANDPIWLMHSVCGVPAPCIANDNYNYFTAGDSVLDNVTWTKVHRQGAYTLGWQGPTPPDPNCQGLHTYGPAYYGTNLIRQEGRQLRIWNGASDELLHEFDLVVGQTLPLSYTNWNEDITVVAVDSVLIGSEMRARYELGNSWAQYLIEGVGSSHGLFEQLSNFFDCGFGLECFGLGADGYYPPEWEGGCDLMMGATEPDGAARFSISPNPTHGPVLITGLHAGSAVEVADAMGRRVIVQGSFTDRLQLDLTALPDGCYLVTSEGRTARLHVAH